MIGGGVTASELRAIEEWYAETGGLTAEEAEADSGQYSDVSIRLMTRQGWVQGAGLGKHGQGTPHLPKATGQTNREGLGFGVNYSPTPESQPPNAPISHFPNVPDSQYRNVPIS